MATTTNSMKASNVKSPYLSTRLFSWMSLFVFLSFSTTAQSQGVNVDEKSKTAAPMGYDGFLVFMANALVNIEDVVPVEGTFFQKDIMGRDDIEFEAVRQEAIQFFATRYGIQNADANPDILFRPYQVEPVSHYRAYIVSGEKVPSSGWEVRDGGWEARVINPDGLVLGGEFEGLHVPPGTFMVFGDYNILTCKHNNQDKISKCKGKDKEIIIHYQSRHPVLIEGPELPGVVTFRFSCEVFSDRWGHGLAQGIALPEIKENGGKFQYNVRNVVTFSNRNGF